jgi:hypothetical protein
VKDAASGDAAYNSTRSDDVGRFWAVGPDRTVEREGVIKFLTVRNLVFKAGNEQEQGVRQESGRGILATDESRDEHGKGRG